MTGTGIIPPIQSNLAAALVRFRPLTCPILDGAVLSMPANNRTQGPDGVAHPRGFAQHYGRFEVKARIPKGLGAFPAAWLLPTEGGWPYLGGEIDVLEARDNANEAYQTYHHGKCYDPATNQEMAATDSADCDKHGGKSVHLDLGYTARERAIGEFWKRDHVYSVEWSEGHIVYFVNNVRIGSIDIGTQSILWPVGSPANLATYNASNFPTKPFYWILNHSTYVSPDKVVDWPTQTFLLDFVKTYARCERNHEFCPCGGAFQEGVGCTLAPSEALHCPAGTPAPTLTNGVTPSACQRPDFDCPNGGKKAGARCLMKDLTSAGLKNGVRYWVDIDPRWPGVYYAPIAGQCSAGGTFSGVNCFVAGFAQDELESGVDYVVDTLTNHPGVFYTPDYR